MANTSDTKLNNYLHGISMFRISIYLLIILVSFGIMKYCWHHRQYQDELAVKKFKIMSYAMSVGDLITANTHGVELLNYSNRTPYPRIAAIFLAKILIVENKLDEAVNNLRLVINQRKKDSIWHIANLRLAKVLLMQNNLSEAKNVLTLGIAEKKFSSRYHELQGDVLFANQELKAANQEYTKALNNLPQQFIAPWLNLKVAETAIDDSNINN
jgi:predicted negative regulator of RcsB-dependent stress response